MDKLNMCRAMEAVCTQHALSDELHRDRWLNLMDEWNERAHKAAARNFQGRDTSQPTGALSPAPSHSNARD